MTDHSRFHAVSRAYLDALSADDRTTGDANETALATALSPLEQVAAADPGALILGAYEVMNGFLSVLVRKYDIDRTDVIAAIRHVFDDE